MLIRLRVLALLLCALAVPALLGAQTADTASLHGHLTDPSHAAVVGVKVTLTNAQTGEVRTATTDASGDYSFGGLPPAGRYTLSASKSGFSPATAPSFLLVGGAAATVDLSLPLAGAKAQVTVTGTVGEVRTDEPQLGDHLDAQQVAEVPLLGNQITSLPLLNSANRPSINMGDVFMNQTLITTGGAGRRQADFVVDGVNSNDDWGRQTIFTALPSSAVEEMTILENPFSAEYGVGSGGVINIVTTSGTQQFHGMGEYTVRPNGMAAHLSGYNSATAFNGAALGGNDQTSDALQQGDWSLEGPLGERTQFAFSGELTSRQRASPVTSPLDPTNYVGDYHDGMVFGRVDHQFSSDHSFFFRGDADSFYDTNPNGIVGGQSLPTVARVFSRRTYEGVFGDNYVINANLVNAARLQFQLADPITAFAPVDYSTVFSVPIAGEQTFTSGSSASALLINRQYELNDTLTGNWGRHTVTFGADGIIGRDGGNSKEFGGPNYLGTFSFPTCTGPSSGPTLTGSALIAYCESPSYINIGNATGFTQSFGNAAYEVDDTIATTFIQDDFHVRSNLTINLGVSYMRQTYTQSDNNWAPRLGFVYSPMKNTVVRGSYGIFYSPVVDDSYANYALTGPTGVANYSFIPNSGCFPTSLTAYPSVPNCGSAPLERALYLQPGQSSYYNQFFPVSELDPGYQAGLENPYTEQWTFGLEHSFAPNWVLSADYIGSHTLRLIQPIDLNAPPALIRTAQNQWRGVNETNGVYTCPDDPGAVKLAAGATVPSATQLSNCASFTANAERPLTIYDAANGLPETYGAVQSDLNDGAAWYDALEINLEHPLSQHIQTQVSYTWSHILDTVDQDATAQNPNNALITGSAEKGNALWNQPNRLVVSGVYDGPEKINLGGIFTAASGLAYNITTGTVNDGDSDDTSRPVVDGALLARNDGVGTPIYSLDPFIERPFHLSERMNLLLRAEAFDVLNHANFVSFNGTYGNGATAAAGFGTPSIGATAQLPAREIQFSARLSF